MAGEGEGLKNRKGRGERGRRTGVKVTSSLPKSLCQMMAFMPLLMVLIGQFCLDVIGFQDLKVIGWLFYHINHMTKMTNHIRQPILVTVVYYFSI